MAEGLTSTNSKRISCDPYPLLLCDVITHVQLTDMQKTHIMWRPPTVDVWCHCSYANCQTQGKHSLLYCCKHVSCLQSCCLATCWSNMPQYFCHIRAYISSNCSQERHSESVIHVMERNCQFLTSLIKMLISNVIIIL
jgi:hypothetical protein